MFNLGKVKKALTAVWIVSIISGCGSSDSGSNNNAGTKGVAPVIKTSGSVTAYGFTPVSISAEVSDKDNDVQSYQWKISSGPAVFELIGANTDTIAFFPPTVAGNYELVLTVTDKKQNQSSATVNVNVTDNAALEAKLQGNWHRKGYGSYISIDGQTAKTYRANPGGCLYLGELNFQELKSQGSELTFIDSDNFKFKDDPLLDAYYSKTNQLDIECALALTPGSDSSFSTNFEYFWHAIDQFHGHLAKRGVDWQTVYQQALPFVDDNKGAEELVTVMAMMLQPLQDFHGFVVLGTGELIQSGRKASNLRTYINRAKGQNTDSITIQTTDVLLNPMQQIPELEQAYTDSMASYVVNNTLNVITNEQVEKEAGRPWGYWGKTDSNIGLMVINHMDYITEENLHDQMETILQQLKDTDGLILDLRTNPGGMDTISVALARHFVSQTTLGFSTAAINKDGESPVQHINIEPYSGSIYQKPVYALISQETASAAESFILAIKDLPNVTLVGENTQGALSNVLPEYLPAGYWVGISNETYYDRDGNTYEGSGIAPDHLVSAFSEADLATPRAIASYNLALELMGK